MTNEEREERRIRRVIAWLDVLEEAALDFEADVLSRSETASESGTDPQPKVRPCEHRADWHFGRLCLVCNNTGMRKLWKSERVAQRVRVTRSREEWDRYFHGAVNVLGGVDPYLVNPVPTGHHTVARDESEGARRARSQERLASAISATTRILRQHEGIDVSEGETHVLRVLDHLRHSLGRDGRQVLGALIRIREASPSVYRRVLAREECAVALLARLAGRVEDPR